MRARLVAAAIAIAAFAACSGAVAPAGEAIAIRSSDSSRLLALGAFPASDVLFTQIPVRVRGALVVEFHGDRATGCAARGLCGFSGTVIWQPPPTGTLAADAFHDHGGTEYDVSLELSSEGLSFGPLVQGGITTADVRSAPNGSAGASSMCTDAAATGAAIEMPVHLRAASLTLATATPSLLGTRCAGPLQSDIASVLARRVVDIATLSHGRVGVSLASSADFAVHGLAGTVTSTVQLSLGRPTTQRVPDLGSSPGRSKARTVVVSYRAHLEGSVVTRAHGDPSSCAPLGSCGANGAFALSVHSTPGTLVFGAITRARRPVRDVLTALGLRNDGNPRGIQVFGIFFVRGPATYAVDVTQGASACRDTAPAGLGTVELSVTRGRLVAAFVSDQQASHLRCPGPMISAVNGLASGSARIGPLARHGGTIHLRTGVELNDDGYTGRSVPNLALTMARPKVHVINDALPPQASG